MSWKSLVKYFTSQEMVEPATEREKVGLRRIRQNRIWMWTLILLWLPANYLFHILTRSQKASWFFGVSWMAVIATAGLRVMLSRCPRCGDFFHWKSFINTWARRCLHCG